MTDKLFYERAAKEFSESRDDALWLKSVVECLGDETKAKFMYLKLRAEELAAVKVDTSASRPGIPASLKASTPAESPDLIEFGKQITISVGGSLAGSVRETFCQILGAKKFDDVLCDLYVSPEVILVAPSAKDRSGLALAGMVLTGGSGVLGVLGMAAGAAIGQVFKNRQADQVKALVESLANTIVIDAKSIELRTYDYRRHWDLAGGEWETRVSIDGKAIFNSVEGDVNLIFACEGKTYERTFFSKANNKVPELAQLINAKTPDIQKETKFRW